MKLKKILIAAVFLALIPLSDALAHKVIIFAWVEDGMIHTESQFGSKRKAKDCVITVLNAKGQKVHEGKTDQNGNYSFKIPENIDSDLILQLQAGTGHKATWKISKEELMSTPSDKDIQAAMEKKDKLESDPSVLQITAGIAIIFLIAFLAGILKKRRKNK